MKEERKQVWSVFEEDNESIWYIIDLVDTITNDNGEIVAEYEVPLSIELECIKEYDRWGGTLIDTPPLYAQVSDQAGFKVYTTFDLTDNMNLVEDCMNWIAENEYIHASI